MQKSRSQDRHKKTKERSEYVAKYQSDHFTRISIVIRNDSGIIEGLQKAVESGQTRNAYIVEAIKRMLQFDDFMPED